MPFLVQHRISRKKTCNLLWNANYWGVSSEIPFIIAHQFYKIRSLDLNTCNAKWCNILNALVVSSANIWLSVDPSLHVLYVLLGSQDITDDMVFNCWPILWGCSSSQQVLSGRYLLLQCFSILSILKESICSSYTNGVRHLLTLILLLCYDGNIYIYNYMESTEKSIIRVLFGPLKIDWDVMSSL